MRLEATVPDLQAEAVDDLADELGLTRSQVVSEAVGLWVKAVIETRRGRRLAAIDASGAAVVELTSPTLTHLEWQATRTEIPLDAAAHDRVAALIADPPAPNAALKRAMKSSRRR